MPGGQVEEQLEEVDDPFGWQREQDLEAPPAQVVDQPRAGRPDHSPGGCGGVPSVPGQVREDRLGQAGCGPQGRRQAVPGRRMDHRGGSAERDDACPPTGQRGVDSERDPLDCAGRFRVGEDGGVQPASGHPRVQPGAQLGDRQPRSAGQRRLLQQQAAAVERDGVQEGRPSRVAVVASPVHERLLGLRCPGAVDDQPIGGLGRRWCRCPSAGQDPAGPACVDHHPAEDRASVGQHDGGVGRAVMGAPGGPDDGADGRVGQVGLEPIGREHRVGAVEAVAGSGDRHGIEHVGRPHVRRQVGRQLVGPRAVAGWPRPRRVGRDEHHVRASP